MAVSPNVDFVSGAILTAQQQNQFPRGVMGYAISTVNTSLSTTETDVTGMTVTFTAVANRLYRATFTGFYQQGSAGRMFLILTDGANVQKNQLISPGLASGFAFFSANFLFTTTAGSTTRKIRATCDAGTATMFGATADLRSYSFSIEDMGLA